MRHLVSSKQEVHRPCWGEGCRVWPVSPLPLCHLPPDVNSPAWGAQSAAQVPASVSRQPGDSSQGLSPDVLTFPRAWRRRRSSLTVLVSWPARYKSPGARLLRLACGSAPVSWAAPREHLPPPSDLSSQRCPLSRHTLWCLNLCSVHTPGGRLFKT